MTFDDELKHENCCDNYIYKNAKAKQVPKYNYYNIMIRLNIMYKLTIEYLNLLLSSKRNKLLVANLITNPKIMIEQTFICKIAIKNFAQWTWPNDGFADLKFLVLWKQQLAKATIQRKSIK